MGTYTCFLFSHIPRWCLADYLITCMLELFDMHRDDILAEDGDGVEEPKNLPNLLFRLA